MIRFKLDENMPVEAAELLHAQGYDAHTVYEEGIAGGDDDSLLDVCKKEGRVLITSDLDFSHVLAYPPSEHQGIVVLRYKRQGKSYVLEHFEKLIPHFNADPLENRLWVVTEKKIRVKR